VRSLTQIIEYWQLAIGPKNAAVSEIQRRNHRAYGSDGSQGRHSTHRASPTASTSAARLLISFSAQAWDTEAILSGVPGVRPFRTIAPNSIIVGVVADEGISLLYLAGPVYSGRAN